MRVIENFYFFNEKSSTGESASVFNVPQDSDLLVVEVYGTASSANITVYGLADGANNDDSWTALGVINRSTLQSAQTIGGKGIFDVSISGLAKVKMSITSISGGNITVIGKAGN